eukprot:CAMPEP_0176373354 /NCGR_PEP_ID=MMETSP0126-20121128/25978_1 /TAXON_ID=141414 ORGANISM="Strombidinopsis acuminatum, Strain SPMC142" /NCGR_SAMPLE_ID=MMETSP0126 /ASSEMBLY_ACC=CAM_ASM_000229 /LENGTH=63 /DNA_ID=CAMNT_0017733455 /DNA_START=52 /DNA_END=246 /DNA_ORIENTATION=+
MDVEEILLNMGSIAYDRGEMENISAQERNSLFTIADQMFGLIEQKIPKSSNINNIQETQGQIN